MNRKIYFDYIQEKLTTLACQINSRGKLNLLDLNTHSETFYADLCNMVFDLQLVNLNQSKQNTEGIDLVDEVNKIIAQVSATSTKQKIESSLNKNKLSTYIGYRYKFISISKESSNLKETTFKNQYNLTFDPKEDILDIFSILRKIQSKNIDEQKSLYEFIKKELGTNLDMVKLDANLAAIINILGKEEFDKNIGKHLALGINDIIQDCTLTTA